jgi:hypothetical protein
MERLDRLAARRRVEDEARSLAPALDLDPEFAVEASSFPEQVDDDSSALAMAEVAIGG